MTHVATCHCGATRIEVDRLPEAVTACTCTWCARTGGLWGYYAPEEVRVIAAPDRVYAPNVLNEHHFCGACSGLMFNYGPKWDEETGEMVPGARHYALNMRMVDEEAARSLPVVELDGRSDW